MANVYLNRHHHRLMLLGSESGDAPPPANGTRVRGSYTSEANFDTNMVIILAALLCALICALGLNSIVRCAIRCGRRLSPATPEEAAARFAASGLKKSALRHIPVVVYGSGVNIPATDCPICLGEFAGGEDVRILPKCNHEFHMRCIDTWLLSHASCPTCRRCLPENLGSSDANGGCRPPEDASAGDGDVSAAVVEDV